MTWMTLFTNLHPRSTSTRSDAKETRAIRVPYAQRSLPWSPRLSFHQQERATRRTRTAGKVADHWTVLTARGEAEDDEKKKRKPVPKLDEARLLGKNGFLQLIMDTKHFKPK